MPQISKFVLLWVLYLRGLGPCWVVTAAAQVVLVEGPIHVICVDAPHSILVFEKVQQMAPLLLYLQVRHLFATAHAGV